MDNIVYCNVSITKENSDAYYQSAVLYLHDIITKIEKPSGDYYRFYRTHGPGSEFYVTGKIDEVLIHRERAGHSLSL